MEPDPLQQAWRSQDVQHVTVDVDALLALVKRNHRGFQSILIRRDTIEIGTALVLTVLFAWWGTTRGIWSWFVPSAVCLYMALFLFVDRRRQKGRSASFGETLADWIEKSRAAIEHQIWLLKNVFWWYLLPPLLGMAVVVAHHVWLFWEGGPASWIMVGVFSGLSAIAGIMSYGIYLLNQHAVRDELQPRLQELRKLAEGLESNPN